MYKNTIFILIMLITSIASASVVDDSFEVLADGGFSYIGLQKDGKIFIGGSFRNIDNSRHREIARLNTDGSIDNSFNFGLNGFVSNSRILTDDKILALRGRGSSNTGDRIVRLNHDGSLDSSFTHDEIPYVLFFELQKNGKILVLAEGDNLFRLNADGTIDNNFNFNNSGVSPCPALDTGISHIVPQLDGDIMIGGCFRYSENSFTSIGLIRVNTNGSVDTDFFVLDETMSYFDENLGIVDMVVQADGKTIFTYVNVSLPVSSLLFQRRSFITRLDTRGSIDQSFDIDPNNLDVSSTFTDLVLEPDGKILIAGSFSSIGGIGRNNIARLHIDGTVDKSINPDVGGRVFDIELEANGKILVVGEFTKIGGVMRSGVARLNANGVPLTDPADEVCIPIKTSNGNLAVVCL